MEIIYLHHGFRHKGKVLTQNDKLHPLGEKEAKIVSKLLKIHQLQSHSIKAIYTSPYLRCVETANIINKHIKLPIIEETNLNEIAKDETLTQLYTRTKLFLSSILKKYEDNDSVICVTSGLNIIPFIFLQYNIMPQDDMPIIGVPSCSPIVFNITKENLRRLL